MRKSGLLKGLTELGRRDHDVVHLYWVASSSQVQASIGLTTWSMNLHVRE